MLDWLRRWRESPALTGAPAVRRLKTYSAASGYVYHYYYEGQRASGDGPEFVFSVSSDDKTYAPVTVRVQSQALEEWRAAHDRALEANERYAVAKIALFQAFDESEDFSGLARDLRVRYADLQVIVETLGLE